MSKQFLFPAPLLQRGTKCGVRHKANLASNSRIFAVITDHIQNLLRAVDTPWRSHMQVQCIYNSAAPGIPFETGLRATDHNFDPQQLISREKKEKRKWQDNELFKNSC